MFTSNTGKFSGAPNSIYILGIELRKKGYDVFFTLPDKDSFYDKLIVENFNVHVIKRNGYEDWGINRFLKSSFLKKIKYIINTYEYFFKLLKYIKLIRPDILHVNTNRDPFPLIVGRLFKIKTLLHVHEIFKKGFYAKYYSAFIFYLANRIIFPKYCMNSYHNSKI